MQDFVAARVPVYCGLNLTIRLQKCIYFLPTCLKSCCSIYFLKYNGFLKTIMLTFGLNNHLR